jgi:ribonuclease J
MAKLTFYGGVNEIGGNKILLEDNGTKIFLDFGMGFGRRGKFFEEFLTPRTAAGIKDFLAMGLVPDIKGIYREDLLTHMGREAEEPEVQGVILSHAHADHANYISFLSEKIPIFCGETCKRILDAIEESSSRDIENEVINFKKRPILPSERRNPPIERTFNTFKTGDKIKIGSIEIEPVHVDHSVPGSYGFVIWTSSGPIIYTGDLRLHGMRSEMTMDFVNKARESKPVAMITEGTRINIPKSDESEPKVYADSKQDILKNNGLTIIDFNFKDVDRFKTFYKIAKDTNRQIVISFKHACYLDQYCMDKKLDVPDCKGENILLFKPKRMTGKYIESDYTDGYIKCRLDQSNIITAEEITKNPSKYMIVLNFWYFNTLVDLTPEKSIYIHSLSEPFNEEMEMSYGRMKNWLEHFNINFLQHHCSGHINGSDMKELINMINPKELFPIHTEKPGLFRGLTKKVKRVKEGKEYKL